MDAFGADVVFVLASLVTMGRPDAERPMVILRIALRPAAPAATFGLASTLVFWCGAEVGGGCLVTLADGDGKVSGANGTDIGALGWGFVRGIVVVGICIVIELVVLMPIITLLRTSS